jgi:hypothetical protein
MLITDQPWKVSTPRPNAGFPDTLPVGVSAILLRTEQSILYHWCCCWRMVLSTDVADG